jgi:predicted alpha/beta-fold hydrolase
MSDNLELIAQFISIGYNVIAYDYRGYGKSDDFPIKNNFFIYPQFVKDITAVVDYTRKYYNTQFDMFGIGIGAGLSLSVGANRPEVRRIIADGTYSSFEQTKNKYKTVKGEDIMMPLAYDKMLMEPLYALASKGDQLYGIMYIVGANEDICGNDEVKALVKLKPKISETYVVPGVKNEATFSSNKNEYFNKVKKFIETHGS